MCLVVAVNVKNLLGFGLWSLGDIRDTSPGFPFLSRMLRVKRILLVALRSLQQVVGRGPPRGCGSSVSLGFDRVGSVSPGLWADR